MLSLSIPIRTLNTIARQPDRVDAKLCDFSVLVEKDYYIDKTHIIHEIFQEDSTIVTLTAPPGFGKSTILSTIQRFVELELDAQDAVVKRADSKNYKRFRRYETLFLNRLNVNRHSDLYRKHFAKYPVLKISFKNFTRPYSPDHVFDNFYSALHAAFRDHAYLANSDRLSESDKSKLRSYRKGIKVENLSTQIPDAFALLKHCIYNHFRKQKIFVLIDDCDTPIFNSESLPDFQENVRGTLRKILFKLINCKSTIKKCIIAGVRLDYNNLLPDPNGEIKKYSFLDSDLDPPCCGLRDVDVDTIFAKHHIDSRTANEVKDFYGCYYNKRGDKLYAPCSIMTYLQSKKLKAYWLESNRVDSGLDPIDVLYALEKILKNIPFDVKYKRLIANLDYKRRNFFRNLKHLGYVSGKSIQEGNISLVIPQQNIRSRISEEEIDLFHPSKSKPIAVCSDVVSQMSRTTPDNSLRRFIFKFRLACNEYSESVLNEHSEFFYFLMFIIAIKTKWYFEERYEILRPTPDTIVIVKGDIALCFLVAYNNDCPLAGLHRMFNLASFENLFSNELQFIDHKVYMGLNINMRSHLHITLAVVNDTTSIESARLICLDA